jgi:benzoate membrane transport protein
MVPLAVTVIAAQNAQGFVILRQAGFAPPENNLTVACGLGSLLFGAFGSVPTCVTGPANAILNTSGVKEQRYMAGVIFGLLAILFGLFAPFTTGLGLVLPAVFINLLGGLAMLAVLRGAFTTAFGGPHALGALVSFLVTLSGIAFLNVGAPFWGLVFGYGVSLLLRQHEGGTR